MASHIEQAATAFENNGKYQFRSIFCTESVFLRLTQENHFNNIRSFISFRSFCLLCRTGLTHMNAKSADREIEKKKSALGDIKNAPTSLTFGSKSAVKKCEVETVNDDYDIDQGYTSLRPVDFHEAWIEKSALSDEDIDRWIKALRDARNANPYDETEPPKDQPVVFDFDECKCNRYLMPSMMMHFDRSLLTRYRFSALLVVEPTLELVPPDPMDDTLDTPPVGPDTSDYQSYSEPTEYDQPNDQLHDSEISALNMSVFEFDEMSGDEDDY